MVVRQLKLSGNHPDLDRYLIGNQLLLPEQHIRIGWTRGMNTYCACPLGGGREVWISTLRSMLGPRFVQKLKQTCEYTSNDCRSLSIELGVLKKFSMSGPPPGAAPPLKGGPESWKLRGSSASPSICCGMVKPRAGRTAKCSLPSRQMCHYMMHNEDRGPKQGYKLVRLILFWNFWG